MTEYKVFIPSAGLGTRLGELSRNRNKALVTVGTKPAICHIIDKFPKDVEVVIALGHMGELTEQFVSLAYPDRKITCVRIQNYTGPGSGLGRTLLDCKSHLQSPFIFCSNDTIIREDIPPPHTNWMGYDDVKDVSQYRTISVRRGLVKSINEKAQQVWDEEKHAYIGLAGILDYQLFWDKMDKGVNAGSIEIGESYGLRELISSELEPKKFTWLDTGNKESLEKAVEELTPDDAPNILPKPNEDIWFVNDRVVKYSTDKKFISRRVQRAEKLEKFVPAIEGSTENMYVYPMVTGKVMSSVFTESVFSDFLDYLDDFWKPFSEDTSNFKELCHKFYKEKTLSRVSQYFTRFSYEDKEETVNGTKLPKLNKLLDCLDWDKICDGVPVRNHGDLHFENVLVSEDYTFVLLDWRQDFAGEMRYGDIYYDLAKILHGIIVSHGIVNQDLFTIESDGDMIKYDLFRKHSLVKAQSLFEKYVKNKGYDWWKVQAMTALIYLNIAPLHHYPYSELLFYLGKDMLAEVTNGTY